MKGKNSCICKISEVAKGNKDSVMVKNGGWYILTNVDQVVECFRGRWVTWRREWLKDKYPILDSAVRRLFANMSVERWGGNQGPVGCKIVERE